MTVLETTRSPLEQPTGDSLLTRKDAEPCQKHALEVPNQEIKPNMRNEAPASSIRGRRYFLLRANACSPITRWLEFNG